MLKRLLRQIFSRAPAPPVAPAAPAAPVVSVMPDGARFAEPRFRVFNKMYGEPPYDDPARRQRLVAAVEALAAELQPNRPGGHAFLADELLVWFRSLGFLSDERFVAAMAPHAGSAILGARLWRVYTLCWAADACRELPGDYVDAGCYDGITVEVMARYADFAALDKTWWLYDLFDNPPAEARKQAHGPALRAQVEARVGPLGRFRVVQGAVPASFDQGCPQRVAFAQIDLNAHEPELACLERLYDRVVAGGMIVLDDYGFVRYRASHDAEKRFFEARGESVLELPTGQGLVVKRR